VHRFSVCALVLVFLAGCGGGRKVQVAAPVPTASPAPPVPRVPRASPAPAGELEGLASYYAEPYHGRRTANGEVFDSYRELTAAHRTLPFDTIVRVKNKNNGKEVEVRINDRGPFIDGRVIDLSHLAAQEIDMVRAGIAPVRLEILGKMSRVYAVQVGAFESLNSAEDLKRKLERKYRTVSVQTVDGDQKIYRVHVGREPDIESARKLAAALRKEELESFVVRVQ
jgi:rare lipoprotein A